MSTSNSFTTGIKLSGKLVYDEAFGKWRFCVDTDSMDAQYIPFSKYEDGDCLRADVTGHICAFGKGWVDSLDNVQFVQRV